MNLNEAKDILYTNGYVCENTKDDQEYYNTMHYLEDAVYGINQTLVNKDIEESYFDEDNLDLIDNSTVEATFYIKTRRYRADVQTRIFFKPKSQTVRKIVVDDYSFEGTLNEFIKLIKKEFNAI